MTSSMKILVTGGAGYIGSHACVAAIEAGYEPVVLDNLVNGSASSVERIAEISGYRPALEIGDINDRAFLDRIFGDYQFAAVIHMAGLKAVGESCEQPLEYYRNNISGAINLLLAMEQHQLGVLIFSSSATVYGDATQMPIVEEAARSATNPYGMSKLMIEYMLEDQVKADELTNRRLWNIACLRYFNPVGAHPSGLIGENPRGTPDNLTPYIARVAASQLEEVCVFGDDYPTPDGTGVRDYIHVMDLVEGHVSALNYLLKRKSGFDAWNLGTGKGSSVLEMITAFKSACSKPIPYRIGPRRPGDIAECWANPAKAQRDLGWQARRGLAEMVEDAWRWQVKSTEGLK